MRLFCGTSDFDVDCLLDTGAERTLLDGQHLQVAGIDIFAGPKIEFHGFLGVPTFAYEHVVNLQIVETLIELPVAFSTQPVRQVLGRDALQFFLVTVRERFQEVYFTPEP